MMFIRRVLESLFSRSKERRQTGRYYLLAALARRLGFPIYNRYLSWLIEVNELSAQWLKTARSGSEPSDKLKDRQFTLYSLARAVVDLPGDTVECGVFHGASSFLIALAAENVPHHCHHVFDSFEGLSAPQNEDAVNSWIEIKWQKHDLSAPLDIVKHNLSRFDFVMYYPGWIPDRFEEIADRKFSFVHIDVDLYQPTHDSLVFFYERMLPGGIIVCDDYGFITCPGATRAFDEFLSDKPEKHVIHLATGQGIMIKR